MTPDPNLTTGTRAYSLVSLATQAETEAREKWLAAGRAYDENRTPENLAALIDARDELKTISQQAASARTVYKHNHLRGMVKR